MTILPSLYLETSLLSYLAARPSGDLIVAGHQKLTWQWWELRRPRYRLFISNLVIDEAAQGDPEAGRRRLDLASGLPLLEFDDETYRLSNRILEDGIIPKRAEADSAHVAVAMRHAVDFVLTWNCRHIANASIRRRLAAFAAKEGYELPIICTPIDLLGEDYGV